ncbi:hypothetical protein [Pseudomonas chlororaphis]|uniref:hypothetical protein n=1 Tax=Pseudomonas chlororaphis TaxID=587753 RepID=UPI003BF8D660
MAATAAHYNPRTTIQLSSILGRKFFRQKDYLLETGSAWEVFRALKATVDGFTEEIARLDRLGMRFAIIRNGKNVGEKDFDLGGIRTLSCVLMFHREFCQSCDRYSRNTIESLKSLRSCAAAIGSSWESNFYKSSDRLKSSCPISGSKLS